MELLISLSNRPSIDCILPYLQSLTSFNEHEKLSLLTLNQLQSSIIARKPSTLAWEPWLSVPFAKDTKTHTDTLVDILLTLPTHMRMTENAYSHGSHSATSATIKLAVSRVLDLKDRLSRWWQSFALQTNAEYDLPRLFPSLYEHTECTTYTPARSSSPPQTRRQISHDLLVELKAKWDMGTLLALSMLATLEADTQQRHDFETQCHAPAAKILAASSWIEDEDIKGNKAGVWHILLPLAVVSMVCPEPEMRKRADSTLSRYGREKALGGVTTMNKLSDANIFGANWGLSESVGDLRDP